jgi:hypothetical protein
MREQLPKKGLASPTRGTAWGLGRGHALGRGSQDSTVDPKGSLKLCRILVMQAAFLAASVGIRKQLSNIEDVIGTLLGDTGESP